MAAWERSTWRCATSRSFTQKVAFKLIKRGMDTDEIVRRFVAERQILASLAHPNIARLFDGGSTPDGRPYFVMEYVEGRPITAYAAEHRLSVEARLRLFLRVCRAVQHAHQSLVVHRDLKPANILVDAEGEPKLLDFGIAKLLDPSSFGGMTALTGLAPGPMTPDYASPEQLRGRSGDHGHGRLRPGAPALRAAGGAESRAVERKLGEGWSDRPPSQAILALAEPKRHRDPAPRPPRLRRPRHHRRQGPGARARAALRHGGGPGRRRRTAPDAEAGGRAAARPWPTV